MAKANRNAIDSSNFWDGHWVHGRYTARPKINAKETKARQKVKRDILRKEQKTIKKAKHNKEHKSRGKIQPYIKSGIKHYMMVKPTKKAKHDQIQYGFDLANWWNEQHA